MVESGDEDRPIEVDKEQVLIPSSHLLCPLKMLRARVATAAHIPEPLLTPPSQ